MIILGWTLSLVFLVVIIAELVIEGFNFKFYIFGLVIAFGVWCIHYDLTSPVEEEVSYIVTSDFEIYGFNVEAQQLGLIQETKHIPLRSGTIWNRKTVYALIHFIDEPYAIGE